VKAPTVIPVAAIVGRFREELNRRRGLSSLALSKQRGNVRKIKIIEKTKRGRVRKMYMLNQGRFW